jgi:hypothetical protein
MLDDYGVLERTSPLIGEGVEATMPPTVRETVSAVKRI